MITGIFTFIGEIVLLIAIILVILMVITLVLGYVLVKDNKLIFPSILLFTLNLSYGLLKRITKIFGLNDTIIDQISIDLRNRMNKEKFKKLAPEDIIIVMPHCLRAPDCSAKLGESGLECIECGRCEIGQVKTLAKEKGIDVYVVPGSTFIKNVVQQREFKGVIGVACHQDLNLAMMGLSDHITQGVYLLKDGCINTEVNVDEIIDLINQRQSIKKEKQCDIDPNDINPSKT